MQDITLTFVDGPMTGRSFEYEVGRVKIGRLPGTGGLELKGANTSVSREHAELVDADGEVQLRNLSPNGTTVNGELVIDAVTLRSGAVIEIGDDHRFKAEWTDFRQQFEQDTDKTQRQKPPTKSGPLASPVVRAVLGVYLLGIVALAVWLGMSGGSGGIAADDWPDLRAEYETFAASGLSGPQLEARLERAEVLVRQLRALRTRGSTLESERICRELMTIDRDIDSPLYRYGVRCLATL